MNLHGHLSRIGRSKSFLLAVDFDGTLAPLVDDPDAATGDPTSMTLLADLAERAGITVAIVSGRTYADLERLVGLGPPVRLIGEHGNDLGGGADLDDGLLARIEEHFEAAADRLPGSFVERKRRTVAFHHRRAEDEAGEAVAASLADWALGLPEVVVTVGKKVVEAAVDSVHKGDAIVALRGELPDGPVVFLGDDTTDEHAFRALREGDVGVKVGEGPTAADYRVEGIDGVREALAVLAAVAARR